MLGVPLEEREEIARVPELKCVQTGGGPIDTNVCVSRAVSFASSLRLTRFKGHDGHGQARYGERIMGCIEERLVLRLIAVFGVLLGPVRIWTYELLAAGQCA